MPQGLVADLALLLKEPQELAQTALESRLRQLESPPPLGEVFELAARARATGASDEELRIAVGTLLAIHANPKRAP